MSKLIELSPAFVSVVDRIKGIVYDWDKMVATKVHKSYRVTFNLWRVSTPSLIIETTITKDTQEQLEYGIVKFLELNTLDTCGLPFKCLPNYGICTTQCEMCERYYKPLEK